MHMFITNIANLVGMNLEIGTQGLVLEGNHFTNLKHNLKVSQGRASVLKQALSRDNMSFHLML